MPGSSHPIQAVLYDIDGTLYKLRQMRLRMALELGRSAISSPIKTLREWKAVQAYRRAQEELRDAPPGASQLDMAARSLGMDVMELRPVIEKWMEQRPLRILPLCVRPPVIDAISLLAGHGVRQAAYSDYPAASKIEVFGIAQHFEFNVCSSDAEVAAYKPSPRGFLHAASRWELDPREIVYVGDRPEVDGVGAEAAGMRFCHVDDLTPERVRRAASMEADSVCTELFGL